MKTLLAGPWFGEMGWEIATWVPTVRAASRKYERTVVVCQSGHKYLYEDFAKEVVFENRPGLADRWLLEGKEHKPQFCIREKYPDADLLWPTKEAIYKAPKEYLKYGANGRTEAEDTAYGNVLMVHARTCKDADSEDRNWPVAKWEALVAMLHQNHQDLLVFSIGSQAGAAHVPSTGDLRDIPMILLCQQMSHAKAVVGPSSGPMHLASFCGCPHVVWTTSEYRKAIKGTNRDRYERIWNPLKTPCHVIDKWEWQPPVEAVYNAIKEYL